MSSFVVDASAVLHLASVGAEIPAAHKLLAPTLLRSQTLSAMHEAVRRDLALTQLQADAFITLDAELARKVEGVVATASIDALS